MDHAQLQHVETLCLALYQGTSSSLRSEAHNQLLVLQTSADYIPQCQYILDNSSQPFAQTLACSSLQTLITQFWNNFTIEQKVDIRNYVLNYLATKVGTLEEYVITQLAKLVSRITKLGWFDSPEHRQIIDETLKFLEATIQHHIVGLKILNALIEEMNNPTPGRTLTAHRKAAVSFRDLSLFQIFQVSITTLRQLQNRSIPDLRPQDQSRIANESLQMAIASLSFDFVGTNSEETADDVGIVQVPSSWRPIVQETSTVQLFFDFYVSSEPKLACLALQSLVQLSSVRRSLFPGEKERNDFLLVLMSGIQNIMKTNHGLDQEENYHEFCRMLGRLKANYQLSELVRVPGFMEWLELSVDFTIRSLSNWQYSMNSIHYLLSLWGRMVAALPYLRADNLDSQRQSQLLRQCVLQVVEAYIKTMLDSVEAVIADEVDDPLDDEGSLKEQMDRLPVLARLQYDTVAQFIITLFEQSLGLYQQYTTAVIQSGGGASSAQARQGRTLEGRLAWLSYMTGAIIGAQAADVRKNPGDLAWDGRLCRCVFQLIQTIEFSIGVSKCDEKLEMGILFFFRCFKKAFFSDPTGSVGSAMTFATSVVPSTPVHPLLSLALSSPAGGSESASEEVTTIYEAIGIENMPAVMNILVNKLCSNIKYWHRSDRILEETLDVFGELVATYNSGKTLLGLESVNFLVHNHVGEQFPFLGYDNDNKYRINFYTTLSRLVFSSTEDQHSSFDTFIAPNVAIITQLQAMPDLRAPAIRVAVIGALRDLRGILTASTQKRSYNLLFESLYPDAFALILRVTDTWFADPIVMTAVLKFLQEIVQNKSLRIVFEQTSANGILLFREMSAVLCSYGSKILAVPVQQDIYLEKYKGVRLMLNTLVCALTGNYVNFGVFGLYRDTALENVLDVSLQLCLQIPLEDVMIYVKLSKAFFAFLEILFRSHLDVLCGLDSTVFLRLVHYCQDGIQANDSNVSSSCASAIDHLATYLFLNMSKEKPTVQMIRAHLATEPDLLHQLMATLFNTLLFAAHANHWAVTRPILSLLLAAEATFSDYQNQLISTQAPENQDKLREEFGKLISDIQPSVEATNRDRFTQRLTVFRLNVRQFLTL